MNTENTPSMSLDNAFNIIVQVTGQHRGTREEHGAIDLALRTLAGTLFPQPSEESAQ